MSAFFLLVAIVPALIVFALAAFYAAEVALALAGPVRLAAGKEGGPLAILVPAHDEEAVIAATLRSVKATMRPIDRILVVADNCADRTAEIARAEGVETIVRADAERRGKGYALQFGLDRLAADPPFGVVVVDADCQLAEGAFAAIADAMAATGRPAQMLCLMRAPDGAPPQRRVAAFAWLLMNKARMRGLMRLCGGARLTGAGMALPWAVAARLDLGSTEIVEDLALSARLTAEGLAPVLVEAARIESVFPLGDAGAATQRARWENGSLRLATHVAPRLLAKALVRGDARLAATALDLAVPPLAVFGAAIAASVALALPASALGAPAPLGFGVAALALFAGATATAWAVFGREALPPKDVAGVAGYLGDKISVYFGRGKASTAAWTRTARDDARREPRP